MSGYRGDRISRVGETEKKLFRVNLRTHCGHDLFKVGIMWKRLRPRKKLNDYYAVLDVSSESSPRAIQHAFWKVALTLHPDVNSDPNALERYKEAVEAYQTLKNPAARNHYDAQVIAENCQILLGAAEAKERPRKRKKNWRT